jgi:hypothetical protein
VPGTEPGPLDLSQELRPLDRRGGLCIYINGVPEKEEYDYTLPNALVQIANKMGLQKKLGKVFFVHVFRYVAVFKYCLGILF